MLKHRAAGQKEGGSGLGLNICIAILKEHGFAITSEKTKTGTINLFWRLVKGVYLCSVNYFNGKVS